MFFKKKGDVVQQVRSHPDRGIYNFKRKIKITINKKIKLFC